jgi:hypothetical protein
MAWSLIAHTAKEGSSTAITTNAIDTTGATLIVICAAANNPGGVGITDSPGNSINFNGGTNTGTATSMEIFWIVNPTTNASHTFTCSGFSFPSLAVLAFSGSYGGAEKKTGANGSGSSTPGSITPTSDNALLVTGVCDGSNVTGSISGGFTISDQIGGSTGQRVGAAYLIQTSAAAANPTWTISGANVSQLMSFLLRPASSGSAGGAYAFA